MLDFKKKRFKEKKYLSVHARGFYDDGQGTELVMKAANQLILAKNVTFIFFATEAKRLGDLAKKIAMRSHLIQYSKEFSVTPDSADSALMRDSVGEMQDALTEWLLVGEADFCTSTTMHASTFSLTALLYGTCTYLPFEKRDVLSNEMKGSLSNIVHFDHENHRLIPEKDKESIAMTSGIVNSFMQARQIYDLEKHLLSSKHRQSFWKEIRHEKIGEFERHRTVRIREQCIKPIATSDARGQRRGEDTLDGYDMFDNFYFPA
jgi:hypothetical protein